MVLTSESWHRRSNGPSTRSPVVDEKTTRSGQWLWSVLCVSFRASILLVGWQQGHPEDEPITQTAAGSVEPFLHRSPQTVPVLYNRPPLPLKITALQGGSGPPSNTCFLGPPKSSTQTASRLFQPFLQCSVLTSVTDRQTDRQTTLLGL